MAWQAVEISPGLGNIDLLKKLVAGTMSMSESNTPNPKPTGWEYLIILTVFALTGTTAAFAPKTIMPMLSLEPGLGYWVVYFLLITPVYQVLLLMYAFIFGKFSYFYELEKKTFRWIGKKLGIVKEEHQV